MTLHIARDGRQLGTFAEAEVQSGLAGGRFMADDLFWTEGMADWQPLRARFAMAADVPQLPPPAVAFNPYATPQASIIPASTHSGYTLASRGARLGAALLDGLVIALVVAIPLTIGAVLENMAEAGGQTDSQGTSLAAMVCFVLSGLAFLGIMIYNMVLLSTSGQTLAKRWLGMRIVSHTDRRNPGFVKAVLLRSFVNGLIGQFVPFYGIVDVCFIFREDQRCVHDLMADTMVIVDKPQA